jgi:outer membrane protein TolC
MPKIASLSRQTCAALALAVIIPAGCAKEKIAPFNPRALQEMERQAAQGAPLRPVRPLPTTLQSPFEDETATTGPSDATTGPATQTARRAVPPATGPALGVNEGVLRMPLREIMQRAVANNLDVKVAGYDPAIDETRITEAEARFDPTFFTNFQYGVDRILAPTPDNPTVSTEEETVFRTYTFQTGVRQELESGGRVEARVEPRHTKRQPGFPADFTTGEEAPNPFWTTDLTLQITQPLLRDFGGDVNRARIVINRNNQKISLLEFRNTLEKNVADLERAYWQLMQAEGEVKIAEELLNRTLSTGQILEARRDQDVGRVQMSQTTSSIENRRTILIRARARVRDLSDQIKRLMNDPDLPVTSGVLILPADAPIEQQIRFNLEDQINTAMENRAELGQQQLRSDNAATAALVAENNLLPQLNFVGNVGTTGLGGSFGDAFEDSDFDHLEYAAGVQLEIPIGNRAARAIWKRAQLQRLQAIAQYRALIEQVALDVKTAIRETNTTWEEIAGTRQARFAAADALDAVEERERASEALTPEFVNRKLDLQQQLAEAQRQEVQAQANYQIALARLEQSKGTLLRYSNIILEEAPLETADARRRR